MRILYLGKLDSPIMSMLCQPGDVLTAQDAPLEPHLPYYDFLVSYNYRHIIPPEVVKVMDGRAINLHISYLPWNRGADPNLWSWVDDTPKGVTIHYISDKVDAGDIIVRSGFEWKPPLCGKLPVTLRESYIELHERMVWVFSEWWPKIRVGDCPREPQQGDGSFHLSRDKKAIVLSKGWDTPVSEIRLSHAGGTTYANSSASNRKCTNHHDDGAAESE